jgi:Sterile alpha motif (SAM)/Pointed domain
MSMLIADPVKWSVHEMRKWLRWTLRKMCTTSSMAAKLVDDWPYDGLQSCRLGPHEFEARFGADADLVLTSWEQWKHLGPAAAGTVIVLIIIITSARAEQT